MAQLEEHLPSKCKAPNSISSIAPLAPKKGDGVTLMERWPNYDLINISNYKGYYPVCVKYVLILAKL
jgi:hypothetical protein